MQLSCLLFATNILSSSLCSIVVQSMTLLCRQCDLLLFSVVAAGDSWRLIFQHCLALSAAIWDMAFLTERHLLVLQAAESAAAVVCTLSVAENSNVMVLLIITYYFV